jgi:AcrR family transcriptional regulator
MSGTRVDRILDAAYACFVRHGVRRTTMDDIATAAGMSRAAIYQYVRNKDDAFRRLAQRLCDEALVRARDVRPGPLARRLAAILDTKLDLTLRLVQDSPHATELLAGTTTISADVVDAYTAEVTAVAAAAIAEAAHDGEIVLGRTSASEVAHIAMAFVRGLEIDLSDPDLPRRRLRSGVTLLVAGLSAREPRPATDHTEPAPDPDRADAERAVREAV